MAPLLLAVLGLGGGFAAFKLLTKPRFLGDLAKPGDEVQVSLNNLAQVNKNIPPLPPNTNFVGIHVTAADKDSVSGPIVRIENTPVPAKIGPVGLPSSGFTVHRVLIDKINRGSKTATSTSAGFHGEGVFQG